MMGHRQQLDGAGFDAFTKWRRWYHWRPGALRWIKTRYARKERRAAKKDLRQDIKGA